jgi:hypothetical protein
MDGLNPFGLFGDKKEEVKTICWRPKQALIECILTTKCFRELGEIDKCIAASECHLEKKNWVLCKLNHCNPRYRLRGVAYDVTGADAKKIEARNARIAKRLAEEKGLFENTVVVEEAQKRLQQQHEQDVRDGKIDQFGNRT